MRNLVRLLGLGLVILAILAAVISTLEPTGATPDAAAQPLPSQTRFASLPPAAPEAGRAILERSPFAQDRTAFDREAATTPPPPPVEVRLTGISKMGGSLGASLLIGGQSMMVKKGDDTPAGKVLKVEPDAVTLEGPPERRLEMFRQ
jgi:hypothetical protein